MTATLIMKAVKTIFITVRSVASMGSGLAEPFRTDINPALLYYQAFILAPELQ